MTRPARVLLAARDPAQGAAAAEALAALHYVTRVCIGPSALSHHVAAFRPDLVVLGFVAHGHTIESVVDDVNASFRPLLLCALDDGATQRSAVLEAGADAYIHEPFTMGDLLVHVGALARRVPWLDHALHQLGSLVVDESAHLALFEDQPLVLSAKEFDLLALLIQHAGAVLSKRTLLETLWGVEAYDENLVEVHVSALRRRLPPAARGMLQTVRGVGYVLREAAPR